MNVKSIFADGELNQNQVVREFRTTAKDGKNYTARYYNLRVATAIGYSVNSTRTIEFRKWATEILH